jgi:hypothetical protein
LSGGFGRTVRILIRIGNASDLIKKYIDPLNFSPLKILLIDSLEKWGGDNILLLGKEGLNTVASTLNPFWKDILDNFSNLQNEKVTDGNDVLSQSIWLNSHIKVNKTSPCLKNWIEKDIYIINDLLDQNKQIMSFEIFQYTYHVDTTLNCHVSNIISNS